MLLIPLGGKTSLGIDCSGLVQISLAAAGIDDAARHRFLQEQALHCQSPARTLRACGAAISSFGAGTLALCAMKTTLLHGNAHYMLVASEPLRIARDKYPCQQPQPISAIKRLEPA